jgi:hypothetical protein
VSKQVSFPRPNKSDWFKRDLGGGLSEESQIINIFDNGESWSGLVATQQGGFEKIDGARSVRGYNDWRPADWVWSTKHSCFIEPNTAWSDKLNCFVPLDKAGKAVAAVPKPEDLPEAKPGEHYQTWRKRVRGMYEQYRDHPKWNKVLSDAWEMNKQRLAGAELLAG